MLLSPEPSPPAGSWNAGNRSSGNKRPRWAPRGYVPVPRREVPRSAPAQEFFRSAPKSGSRIPRHQALADDPVAGAPESPVYPRTARLFQGRDGELETLCTLLADTPGMAVLEADAGAGKTALAIEFARRHHEEFDALFWLTCGSRSAAALAGDLAAQLGVRLDRDLESNLNELRRLCAHHRCLLILDDASASTAAVLAPRGRTSVLMTSRSQDLAPKLSAVSVPVAARVQDASELADTIREPPCPAQRLLSAICACAPIRILPGYGGARGRRRTGRCAHHGGRLPGAWHADARWTKMDRGFWFRTRSASASRYAAMEPAGRATMRWRSPIFSATKPERRTSRHIGPTCNTPMRGHWKRIGRWHPNWRAAD